MQKQLNKTLINKTSDHPQSQKPKQQIDITSKLQKVLFMLTESQQNQSMLSKKIQNQSKQKSETQNTVIKIQKKNKIFKQLQNVKTTDIKIKKKIKRINIQDLNQQEKRKQNAKKFVLKVKRQKQDFLGHLFLIKKKQEQNQLKKQIEQAKQSEKEREDYKTQRIKKAFQNIELHRYRTQKRKQILTLKEKQRVNSNSYDQQGERFQLPVINQRFKNRRFNLAMNESPKMKINSVISEGQSSPTQKYYKSKYYVQEQKKKYKDKIQRLQKYELILKKNNFNIQTLKKLKQSKVFQTDITESKIDPNQNKTNKISRQEQYQLGNHYLKISKQRNQIRRRNSQQGNQYQSIDDNQMKAHLLKKSDTADITIETKISLKPSHSHNRSSTQRHQFDDSLLEIKKKIEVLKNLIKS